MGLKKLGGSSPPGPASKMLAKASVWKGGSWSRIPAFFFHENAASRTFLKCYFEYFFLSQPVSVPNFAQSRFSGSIQIPYVALYFGEIPGQRIPFQTLQGCLREYCTDIDQFICHVALDKN